MQARYELFPAAANSLYSSVFAVPPGKTVMLTATGFEQFATQEPGEFRTHQIACIQRCLYDFDGFEGIAPCYRCGDCHWILDISRKLARELAVVDVFVPCSWTMSMCEDFKLLGIPGSYRFALNDQAAVGKVQIYAELYDSDSIAPANNTLYFQ